MKNGLLEMKNDENVLNEGEPIVMVPVEKKKRATRKKPISNIVKEVVDNFTPEIGCYPVNLDDKLKLPEYATENAACFDLFTYLIEGVDVVIYNSSNYKKPRKPLFLRNDKGEMELSLILNPGERALAPTGITFAIPNGYSIRLHPRSGLALKHGIGLANSEGVIDDDYVNPTYVMLSNESDKQFVIRLGDRLCQGEIYKNQKCTFKKITTAPKKKTDRTGGFGSTGLK